MQINGLQSSSAVQSLNRTPASKPTAPVQSPAAANSITDQLDLSAEAQALGSTAQVGQTQASAGIRTDKVDAIRQALNNGTYEGAGAASQALGQAVLTNVNGGTIPAAANNQLVTGVSAAATNATDPGFKIPSQWRATLSADWTPTFGESAFGRGWTFGADLFYSDVRNQVFFTDARSVPTALTTPDGRVRYRSLTTNSDTFNDIILTNTKRGRSYVAVARVRKDFDFGLNLGASYRLSDTMDLGLQVKNVTNRKYVYAWYDSGSSGYSPADGRGVYASMNLRF
jgi:anti-sigma28 factor (negative regulator of flagellin synthesis)